MRLAPDFYLLNINPVRVYFQGECSVMTVCQYLIQPESKHLNNHCSNVMANPKSAKRKCVQVRRIPKTCSSSCLLCCTWNKLNAVFIYQTLNNVTAGKTWPKNAYFGIDVSAHSFWYPGCLVEVSSSLLLWVSRHICHQLKKQNKNSFTEQCATTSLVQHMFNVLPMFFLLGF